MRERKSVFNKKGNAILDGLTFILVLLAFGVISMVMYNVWNDLEPGVSESINNTEANETLNIISENYPSMFDGAFMFVFIGLWITVLVASFMIDSHPIFFVVSLILMIAVTVVSVFLGNAYEEIMLDTDFNDVTASFPATHFILSNLLMVVIVISASIILVLYAKVKS